VNSLLSEKNDLDQKALKIIFEAGEKGLIQSELWKKLGVNSRLGSRLAQKFEEKEKITREKELYNSRWTYRIYIKREPVTLDSINGCPCLICDDIDKCFRGGTNDPTVCPNLTVWIGPKEKTQDQAGI
jgi:hypothetical protein